MNSTKGLLMLFAIGLVVKHSVAQDCASGWEGHGTNCFAFKPDDHMGWNDAQELCQSLRPDSNLASIHTKEENDWIEGRMEELTDSPTLANYWIGLKYDGNVGSGRFVWIDGSAYTYTNWAPDEPNNIDETEDCGEVSLEVHDQGKWNDIACTHAFGYVCKYHTGAIITTTSSPGNGAETKHLVAKWRGILFFLFTILLSSIL